MLNQLLPLLLPAMQLLPLLPPQIMKTTMRLTMMEMRLPMLPRMQTLPGVLARFLSPPQPQHCQLHVTKGHMNIKIFFRI